MSQLVSLTSEHLITSILLQRVQMESLDGTGTDRRKALIGCLWLSGRRSRAIILSLGGDTLTSYLVGFSLPPSAFQFFHLFIAPHFHIQSPIKPDAAALCLLLPHHLPLACAQISDLMNTLSVVLQETDALQIVCVTHMSESRLILNTKDQDSFVFDRTNRIPIWAKCIKI